MATTVTIPTINPATITRAELTALVDRCLATAEPEAARMRQRAADAVAAARYCDSCIAVLKGMREASPTPHALSVLRDLCVIDF